MSHKKRVWVLAIAVPLVASAIWFGARIVTFSKLHGSVEAALDSLRAKGVLVRYDVFDTNPWSNTVTLKGLVLERQSQDFVCVQRLTFGRCELSGISLIALLLRREVEIDNLLLGNPEIHALNNFLKHQNLGSSSKINGLLIHSITIDSLSVTIMDSVSCKTLADVSFNLTSQNLQLEMKDSLSGMVDNVTITNVQSKFPEMLYQAKLLKLAYDGRSKTASADSVVISPLYDRAEFAKRAGRQIDWIECAFPIVKATGVDGISRMNHIAVKFRIAAFRDKRIPRKPRKPTVLPVSFLRKFKVPIVIDSLTISDSYISYEEFPESGSSSGKIFFDNLQVRIGNISNQTTKDAVMSATTRFMNAGDLSAAFSFPADASKPSFVRGRLSNFPLQKINGILVPAANVEIESGMLNELKFQFQYNEFRSDGEAEISYSDLKINKLRKNDKHSEDKFLSMLIDLVLKNDLDKSDSKKKRTGTIQWQRDPQRGIFNYWWKSVFSGIKSIFVGS